ncbi:WhiB family transcriptional regulator [Streptosporangium roseum]|uniref:WhiB family transcriptional regulator n=1 Tax=Streptosporangium roseum TaxID=2001 RepID=UPI003320B5BA
MTWATRGACRNSDPELFFPLSHLGRAGQSDTEKAKAVCRTCRVLTECRAYVRAHPQEFGVWAETTPEERREPRAAPAPA